MASNPPVVFAAAAATANARALAWRPSPSALRIYFKQLASCAGWTMRLVRYDPGGAQPPAGRRGPRFLYVMEGELIHAGQRLWPGAAVADPPGSAIESHSDVGCTLLELSQEEGC
jgi:hypothetical protein